MAKKKILEENYDKLISLDRALIDDQGREVLNPVPREFPAKLRRPNSTMDLVKRYVREEVADRAREEGVESFADFNDFEVEDDFDEAILTKYQLMDHEAKELLDFKEEVQAIVEENKRLEEEQAAAIQRDKDNVDPEPPKV